MKIRVLLLFLLCAFGQARAQKLSSEAEISVLTCAPGEELYSLFGHSAVRVKDPVNNFDKVFNYGTFNFNTPNFYMKFLQGKLDYLLSVADYERFLASYQREMRSIYSQELQISQEEKQQLFEALLNNYKPENRAYKYDFFMDNCATRIDSIIKKTIKGNWENHTMPTKFLKTYRTGIAPYLANSDWLNLGLNIILGVPTDSPQQGLFLPDIIEETYRKTTLNGKPIVGKTETLYESHFSYSKTPMWKSPLLLFSLLAFFLLMGTLFFPNKLRFVDFLLFGTAGVAGCIIAFLWFFAEHTATNENWNILWALPTHLPLAFVLLFRKRKTKFVHYYFLITLIIDVIVLLFAIFPLLFGLFEYLPLAFPFGLLILILLCLIIRSLGIVQKKA